MEPTVKNETLPLTTTHSNSAARLRHASFGLLAEDWSDRFGLGSVETSKNEPAGVEPSLRLVIQDKGETLELIGHFDSLDTARAALERVVYLLTLTNRRTPVSRNDS